MLELSGFACQYPDSDFLVEIPYLKIPSGEITMLVGPNGSGKSTLLSGILGVAQKVSGTLSFDDEDIHTASAGLAKKSFLSRTSFLPQHVEVVQNLNVVSNVLLGLLGQTGNGLPPFIVPRSRREAAIALLGEFNLSSEARTLATSLSGGQKQRVLLARALIRSPGLLILDESVSALDPASFESSLRILSRYVSSTGATAIIAAHQPVAALPIVDNVCALKDGKLLWMRRASSVSRQDINEIYA